WYHNNVLLSSMPGRTRKSTVSNTFPVSLHCRQKRYQLDAILLLMGGILNGVGIVSFMMQPFFCIQI
ncbi:hypothetical protein ACIXOK_23640, partial [Bacteroides fragilis]